MTAGSAIQPGRYVVIKVGTNSLATSGTADVDKLDRLRRAVVDARGHGLMPVLVTSGAIALGRHQHPVLAGDSAGARQAAAAVGQGMLYGAISESFAAHGIWTGQILLRPRDLINPDDGNRLALTFERMRETGLLPVVNENDALGVRNNDVLAALLSGYLRARTLVLLTDVPGLLSADPSLAGDAALVRLIPSMTPEVEAFAGDAANAGGTGGMLTKLCACWIATYSGVEAVIGSGADISALLAERARPTGTVFEAQPLNGDQPDIGRLWQAFKTQPRGSIRLTDDGLHSAERGEPLLLGQVSAVEGRFEAGDVVSIDAKGPHQFARGSIRLAATEICASGPGATLFGSSDYTPIRRASHDRGGDMPSSGEGIGNRQGITNGAEGQAS